MMTRLLLALTILFPLLLAMGYLHRGMRVRLTWALPAAPLPGLILALLGSEASLALPSLLEGSLWGLDPQRRGFLAFTCLLWLLAGLHALFYEPLRGEARHFTLFWLFTLCGNLGVILAQDIAGFYTFFTLLSLASYGLVAHWRSPAALRAGRIYIVMALAGEMALLSGLTIAAAPDGLTLLRDVPGAVAVSPYRDWAIGLLFFGFGAKAGLPLVHMWLPLAHQAAPTPASAVLSGAMIKAGLIGWLFCLPLGGAGLSAWGELMTGLGLLAVFGAALWGVCQSHPKAVLAYSSISQMGLMTLMLGVGMAAPGARDEVIAVLSFYAMHHGLAKGALFLATGTAPHAGRCPRPLFWALAWLPGLSLGGLLLTSGAAAKEALKEVLSHARPDLVLASWLPHLLSAGAVATTLLVARFLWCMSRERGKGLHSTPLVVCWSMAVLASAVLFWALPRPDGIAPPGAGLSHPFETLWPVLAGLALAGAAMVLRPRRPPLPGGDLVVPLEAAWPACRRALQRAAAGLFRLQQAVVGASRGAGGGLLRAGAALLEGDEALRSRSGLAFAALLALMLLILL